MYFTAEGRRVISFVVREQEKVFYFSLIMFCHISLHLSNVSPNLFSIVP